MQQEGERQDKTHQRVQDQALKNPGKTLHITRMGRGWLCKGSGRLEHPSLINSNSVALVISGPNCPCTDLYICCVFRIAFILSNANVLRRNASGLCNSAKVLCGSGRETGFAASDLDLISICVLSWERSQGSSEEGLPR